MFSYIFMGFGKELLLYGAGGGFCTLGYSAIRSVTPSEDFGLIVGVPLIGLGAITIIYGSAYGIAYRKSQEKERRVNELENKIKQMEINAEKKRMEDIPAYREKVIKKRNEKIDRMLEELAEMKENLDRYDL